MPDKMKNFVICRSIQEKSIPKKDVVNWDYIGDVVEGCRLRISCRASNLILKNEGSAYFVYAENKKRAET